MTALANLLARLDDWREGAAGQYMARCPAHEDGSPSLTVTEAGDGRVLVHCFAGCETEAVVGALGLAFADLYPDAGPDRVRQPASSPGMNWREGCKGLLRELDVIELVGRQVRAGLRLTPDDADRLVTALERVTALRRELRVALNRKGGRRG